MSLGIIMKSILNTVAIIGCGLILGQSANAKPMTEAQVMKLTEVGIYIEPTADNPKPTNWYATPVAVIKAHPKTKIAQTIMLQVFSSGYYDGFDRNVELNCVNPSKSSVHNPYTNSDIPLKTSMAYEFDPRNPNFEFRMERKAVEGMYKKFC